jgi:hypothetical protein
MAAAGERGFAFKDLPMVVDPAAGVVEIKVVPYRAEGEEPGDRDVQFAQYHRVTIPHQDLPCIKGLDLANIYGDSADFAAAEKAFAYGADGVLSAILYRDGTPHRNWIMERMPEEFTGSHVPAPSVRFMFDSLEDARQVADLAGRLQAAIRAGLPYAGIQDDAQLLINIVVGKGSEPRLVAVADPMQRRQF